jgi:sugar fermentation stimulation protein A
VSFVEDGLGKFPDAPTERGSKHLMELTELKHKGYRTAVLFVSQRSDTRRIIPNDSLDPKFGECLRKAHQAGVELVGYNCKVTPSAVSLWDQIEVVLP